MQTSCTRFSSRLSLLNVNIKLICLSNFLFCFGDGLFRFFLPVHIRELNASPVDVGFLFSLNSLILGMSIIFGGFLADRFDTKKIMILGSILFIPVPLAIGFATDWQQLWLPMILYGTYFASTPICVYLLRVSPEKIMQTFGLLSASAALGYTLSPLVGGIVSSSSGQQSTFLISSILFSASLLPLLFIKRQTKKVSKESKTSQPNFSSNNNSSKLLLLCCFFSSVMFFVYLINPLISQFTNGVYHQSIINLGIFASIAAAGSIFFSLTFGKIGDKRSKTTAVTAAIAVSSFSFLIIALFNNFPVLCAAFFLTGATSTIMYFVSGIVGAAAPENAVGKWTSISQASITIAGLGAPILGGVLYQISPYLAFITSITMLSFLAFIGLLISSKEP